MSEARAISTTSRRELSSSPPPASKAPKEIHATLTETLACFLPGRAKDLSARMYFVVHLIPDINTDCSTAVYSAVTLLLKRVWSFVDFSGRSAVHLSALSITGAGGLAVSLVDPHS